MAGTTRLVDIVFPGDTNHHGTLFGGVALSHMDKVAFMAATRHGRVDFVTASCERIDFAAPARLGEIIELTGRIVRVGRRSLSAEVELVAEELLTGNRRRCSRGVFNMVAIGDAPGAHAALPLSVAAPEPTGDFRMAELVLPEQTSHYGSLYGGHALAAMGKAAFVVATRSCRRRVVMAAAERVDFVSQIQTGEMMELVPRLTSTGRTSLTVSVELWAEGLHSSERRHCGTGTFVMVAVDNENRPLPLAS
jgi:acyl-CoA hydrolase